LQDTNGWIVFPPETDFFTSTDNVNFTKVASVNTPADAKDYKIQIAEIGAKINTNCRYIKIVAKNYGELPSWHEGAGGKAHLFFDEITVK
jgi:hypothetical protein